MNTNSDYDLARRLQDEFDKEISLPSVRKKISFLDLTSHNTATRKNPLVLDHKNEYADPTRSVVDPKLEQVDPHPDLYKMFVGFDKRFFWGKLGAVEVQWSKRMTTCAGICYYSPRSGSCVIRLSEPLLKLRSRKDLVETLLHEMIHAYLYVTKDYRDRNDHGPVFQAHMNRINQSAGTHITIYHTFHGEVRHYQGHWWRCVGPCRERRPFFGYVKRATNHAPGPSYSWWSDHQRTCGGTFVKIKEPDDYQKKRGKNSKEKSATQTVTNYFPVSKTSTSVHGVNLKSGDFKTGGQYGGLKVASGGNGSVVLTEKTKNVVQRNTSTDLNRPRDVIPFSGNGCILGAAEKPPISEKPWLKRFDGSTSSSTNSSTASSNGNIPRSFSSSVSSDAFGKKSGGALGNEVRSVNASGITKWTSPPSRENLIGFGEAESKSVGLLNSGPSDSKLKKKKFEDTGSFVASVNYETKKQKFEDNDCEIVDSCVDCPICEKRVDSWAINEHLDICLTSSQNLGPTVCSLCKSGLGGADVTICGSCKKEIEDAINSGEVELENDDEVVSCPICASEMSSVNLESHLENCVPVVCKKEDSVNDIVNDNFQGQAVICPICSADISYSDIEFHVEFCGEEHQ